MISIMDAVDAKILVVDDDAEIRHVLRTVLEHTGLSVIAFTALSSQHIEKELFALGVQGFMRKPLRIKDLQQMVAAELERIGLGQSEILDS